MFVDFSTLPATEDEAERWQQALEEVAQPVTEAIIAFGRTADRYIFGPEAVSWWHRFGGLLRRFRPRLPSPKLPPPRNDT